MANTITLTTPDNQQPVSLEIPPKLNAIAGRFAWAQSASQLTPGRVAKFPDVTTASTTLVDATDFESGDATIGQLVCTPRHISQPFHVSHDDAQGGVGLSWLYQSNLNAFADSIWLTIAAALTEANYGTPVYSGAAAAFARGDVPTLRSAVQTPRRSLILSTGLFNGVADSAPWPIPGVDVQEVSDWSTAGTGIQGFLSDPAALVVLSGFPLPWPRSEALAQRGVSLPGLNLAVQYTEWLNRGTQTRWAAFETFLGVCVGKAAYGKLLKVV